MGFQFYIEKIKISSSVHIINFDIGLVTNKKKNDRLIHIRVGQAKENLHLPLLARETTLAFCLQ